MKKALLILLSILSLNVFADWAKEEKKIDYLLKEVSNSQGIFMRNGSEHTSKEASEHLSRKLRSALSSWFTPKKEEWTALLFIEKVASKSSFSGKSYKIKFNDGKVVETKEWLNKKLESYKETQKK